MNKIRQLIFILLSITLMISPLTALGDETDIPYYVDPVIVYSFDDSSQIQHFDLIMKNDNSSSLNTEFFYTNADLNSLNTPEGVVDNGLYMDGTFGISLNIHEITDKADFSSFSVSFFIKPDVISSKTPTLSFIHNLPGSGSCNTQILLDYNWNQPDIYTYATPGYIDDTGTPYSSSYGVTGMLTPGEWNHIVLTVDGFSKTSDTLCSFNLYIDGKQQVCGDIPSIYCDSITQYLFGTDLNSNNYKGLVDEINFYDVLLFPSQVLFLYDSYFKGKDLTNTNPDPDRDLQSDRQPSDNDTNSYIPIEQGTLPSYGSSHLNPSINPGLAGGIEYTTDSYAQACTIMSFIFFMFFVLCILIFRYKQKNHY